MRKERWLIWMGVFLAILPWVVRSEAAAAEKVVTVRLTGHMPVGQHCSVAAERFIKEAEERSKGTLKFTYYPAGQLAMDKKAFDMCQKGGIEMAQFFSNRAVGVVPETDLVIPYFDDPDWYARRNYDPEGGGGLFYKFIRPKFAKAGLHILPGIMYAPEHSTITKKPIRKMDDYKGLKLRSSGRSLAVALESWGAKSVVMSSADVYMAMQRGTIDGANSGLTTFRSRKWFEVQNHVQMLWEIVSTLDMLANLKWWNSLAPDQQKVLEEALRSATIWSWDYAIAGVEKDVQFLKEKGLTVVDFKKTYPAEWEKMRQANLKAQEKLVGPVVGPETWKEHIRMLDATKDGKLTWREVFQKIKW